MSYALPTTSSQLKPLNNYNPTLNKKNAHGTTLLDRSIQNTIKGPIKYIYNNYFIIIIIELTIRGLQMQIIASLI